MENEIKLNGFDLKPILEIQTLNSAYMYNFNKEFKGNPESHLPIELIYIDKGSQTVHEGKQSYVLNQGQAFLHKPLILHSDETNNVATTAYIFSFTCKGDVLSSLYDQVLNLDENDVYNLKEAFNLIRREGYQNKSDTFYIPANNTNISEKTVFAAPQKIRIKLETFFINLLEKFYHVEEETLVTSKSTKLLKDEIKNSIYSKFNLGEVSKKLYYSKSYLCRKFKEDTGITIVQYLYEAKIEEAKTLLLNTTNSLKDISDMLHFESVQYFNYVFKKYAGLSPNQWKKIVSKPRYY